MHDKIRFVSPLERALYLKSVDALRNLAPADLAPLAQRARERFFTKGDVLFRRDEPVESFHIVVSGKIRGQLPGAKAHEFGPAEVLGVLELLAGSPTGMDAVAAEDASTLEIDRHSLYEVFEDRTQVLFNTIRTITKRTLELRRRIPDGTFLGDESRVFDTPPAEFGLIERVLVMLKGVVFKRVNMDTVVELSRQAQDMRFEPGDTLWRRGDSSGFIYMIITGKVGCEIEPGRSFTAGPGYPLGNLESIAGEPRWYDVIAQTPVLALRSRTEVFFDLLEDHFEMAGDYLAALADNLLRILREEMPALPHEEAAPTGSDPSGERG